MVPWWKRLIYSLVAVIFGGSLVGAVASCQEILFDPARHLDLERIVVSSCIVLVVSLAGWLVAVPIVIIVKDYSGWRIWACGITGVCIGPFLIFGIGVYVFLTDPQSGKFLSGISGFMVLSGAVSLLTTAMYLLLVSGQAHRMLERKAGPK
jgi:hypothetical protein